MLRPRQSSNDEHAVVPFRRRPRTADDPAGPRRPAHKSEADISSLLSLAKYGRGRPDDYRERMIINGLAFVFTAAMIAAGVWLASNLHD
jgi:hypothetical protein